MPFRRGCSQSNNPTPPCPLLLAWNCTTHPPLSTDLTACLPSATTTTRASSRWLIFIHQLEDADFVLITARDNLPRRVCLVSLGGAQGIVGGVPVSHLVCLSTNQGSIMILPLLFKDAIIGGPACVCPQRSDGLPLAGTPGIFLVSLLQYV